MILVDTSVWIDHFRSAETRLVGFLDAGLVLTHPFVIGELALGRLKRRNVILDAVSHLSRVVVATDAEVLHSIDSNELVGCGVGYVDAHLLSAARLTAGVKIWTNDKRLHLAALAMRVAFNPQSSQHA